LSRRTSSIPHWHANKRWTIVDRCVQALEILESKFENKKWTDGDQAYFASILLKRGLSESGNPRSARAIMGTFKFFGFAYVKDKVVVTSAGKQFIHGDRGNILKRQLLKWQYPNPYEMKGQVAPYTRELKLHPFTALLFLLRDLKAVTEDELALFVWRLQSDDKSSLGSVKEKIEKYRQLGEEEKKKFKRADPLFITNHEYEAHLRPYILETGLCEFDESKRELRIATASQEEVDVILQDPVPLGDFSDETEWFEYFGDPRFSKPPSTITIRLVDQNRQPTREVFVEISTLKGLVSCFTDRRGCLPIKVYENESCKIEVYHPVDGSKILSQPFVPIFPESVIKIPARLPQQVESVEESLKGIESLLKGDMDEGLKVKMKMLTQKKILLGKKDLARVRGGRLEQLVHIILENFKARGIFDEVRWNGTVGEFGLPSPAPGREAGVGVPDIVTRKNNIICIVEVTLLGKGRRLESTEGASVPDHIEQIKNLNPKSDVMGLFVARELDKSVVRYIVNRALSEDYVIVSLDIRQLIDILRTQNETNTNIILGQLKLQWISLVRNHMPNRGRTR